MLTDRRTFVSKLVFYKKFPYLVARIFATIFFIRHAIGLFAVSGTSLTCS